MFNDPGFTEDELASAPAEKPVDPRRAHQCRHDGCSSPAEFDVFLHVRYGWHLVAIESLKSSLRVCDQHRKSAAKFLTSEHNKKTVSAELAKIGRLGIDWPNAMVEFVPCGEQSWGPQNMVQVQTGKA